MTQTSLLSTKSIHVVQVGLEPDFVSVATSGDVQHGTGDQLALHRPANC